MRSTRIGGEVSSRRTESCQSCSIAMRLLGTDSLLRRILLEGPCSNRRRESKTVLSFQYRATATASVDLLVRHGQRNFLSYLPRSASRLPLHPRSLQT